jgi:cephalosporin hydroxylase
MKYHFDKYLNIREMILTYRPEIILEMGARVGQNTVNILKLRDQYPFRLVTISDGPIKSCFYEVREAVERGDCVWIQDISYKAIGKWILDKTIGMVLIDTDHNYWTLKKELTELYPKLSEQCIIVVHDTVVSLTNKYYDLGVYFNGDKYPFEEIQSCVKEGKVMNDAIEEFIAEHPNEFSYLRMTRESCGAIAISRNIYIPLEYTECV